MINYWWVTRPKRKLNSVPQVLASIVEATNKKTWQGQLDVQLSVEDALETSGLKRIGERRDQGGSGARTYIAWLKSLGLLFSASDKSLQLTIAGESVLSYDFPYEIIKDQVLKFQYPSSFSLSKNIEVSSRFKIHPFIFLLKLLALPEINYLTKDEIAKIVIIDGEKDSKDCLNKVANKILDYRVHGDSILDPDFIQKYGPSKGSGRYEKPFDHLQDVANTIINWLEYTQLASRNDEKNLQILPERKLEVFQIINKEWPFITDPENEEKFQRRYGLDFKHNKDTRDLTKSKTITDKIIQEMQIEKAFIELSLKQPITGLSAEIIDKLVLLTGINQNIIQSYLFKRHPNGAIGTFMSEYFDMAFSGREDATEFEKATVAIFRDIFNFKTEHVGPKGLSPDVLLISDIYGYQAIIDNKAYKKYSISNDHRNRMIHNYLGNYSSYSNSKYPIGFFSYIAGGFSTNINEQIRSISNETNIPGSVISVTDFIELIKLNSTINYTHDDIRRIFSTNKQIERADYFQYPNQTEYYLNVAENKEG